MRNRRIAGTLLLLMLLVLPLHPAAAQEPLDLVYVGRSDTNADGAVDSTDSAVLYVGSLGGISIPVSPPELSVLQFDVRPDFSAVAYTTDTPEGMILNLTTLADFATSRIAISDLSPLSVSYFDDAVWVVGTNASDIPVLRGFDPVTGAQVGENVFRRPNTDITLHPSGRWALAFNAEVGGIGVLTLPAMQSLQFELTGYAVTPPQWSPAGERFMIVTANAANEANLETAVVDVNSLTTSVIDTPDYPENATVTANWSADGRFIAYTGRSGEATPQPAPLTLIDVTTSTLSSIEDPAAQLSIIEWSLGDSYALVSSQPLEGSPDAAAFPELRLYETATGELTQVASLASLQPLALEWSPVSATIGVLGQSLTDGTFGVFTVSVLDDSLQALFSADAAPLSQADIGWTTDGSQIIYAAPSGDALLSPLGTPIALYAVNASTSDVVRISPENVIIELLNIHIR